MKTAEQARANLESSITYVPTRYAQGVSTADWAGKAGSDQAEKNFADAMAKVISQKRRQTNVKRVSNADWQNAAVNKGAAVIGQRMRDSLDKQAQRWQPIYAKVQTEIGKLPAKTADPIANVNNRVVGTVKAWLTASGKA